ncbi:cation diffusion facilitator family transporter [Suttonella sp. R2A3]|uniref:cation diffusion facilitator family transporter n=1 Tax=Suttonella sp. R2A3 TaxID=2908648 RepID=UPI001F445A84|nr:cation diffusion facilitator family transporter [Suttonella sp. R2A3]UJF24544.1 cation diffusion facilitator family transporter [Suttonella sp. R2A3]
MLKVNEKTNRHRGVVQTAWLSIIGNTLLALIKGITGVFGHSHALIADAIESTSDVFSSILLLLGLRFAQRPADDNHPYGHGRAESLTTFIIVGFLLTSATIIALESIEKIRTPVEELPAPYTLIVLAGVIIVKELLYRVFDRRGKDNHSSALSAEAWHHRSDAITSLAAFIGISIALIMGKNWVTADAWAALFAAGIIYINAWRIFRPVLGEVMDEDNHNELREQIVALVGASPEVVRVDECLIRKMGSEYIVDLCIVVPSDWTVKDICLHNGALRQNLFNEHRLISRVFIEVYAKGCLDTRH